MFGESSVKEIKARLPKKWASYDPNSYAFRFYDQVSTKIVVDGKTQTVYGDKKNLSPMYYPGGVVYNLEQIKALPGDYAILISNMEGNNYTHVVQTRCGNFQEFKEGDVLL